VNRTPVAVDPGELRGKLLDWVGMAAPCRASVADTVRRLGAVQIDPVQVVAPAHLWTLSLRRGATTAADLDVALATGEVFEAYGHARVLVHRDRMPHVAGAFRRRRQGNAARAYGVEDEARSLMAQLERGDTVQSRDLASVRRVSGGWDTAGRERTKATSAALEVLWWQGRIAVVSRAGGQKQYRLTAAHLPELERMIETLPEEEAERAEAMHAFETLGVMGPGGGGPVWGSRRRWAPALADEGFITPVEAAGVRWWVRTPLLDRPAANPRRALLLAPLDNLLWHRPRLEALWDFRYRWEIYTPHGARRVGAYNMPVLLGTRFWGEADARWDGGRLTLRLVPTAPSDAVPAAIKRAQGVADRLCGQIRGGGRSRDGAAIQGGSARDSGGAVVG
jgi:uncharacterized protein YcaQ